MAKSFTYKGVFVLVRGTAAFHCRSRVPRAVGWVHSAPVGVVTDFLS